MVKNKILWIINNDIDNLLLIVFLTNFITSLNFKWLSKNFTKKDFLYYLTIVRVIYKKPRFKFSWINSSNINPKKNNKIRKFETIVNISQNILSITFYLVVCQEIYCSKSQFIVLSSTINIFLNNLNTSKKYGQFNFEKYSSENNFVCFLK